MKLKINDEYQIKSDAHCWMIQRLVSDTDKKTGEKIKRFKTIRWYTSLPNTIRGLSELILRTSEAETLVEALTEIERLVGRLEEALGNAIEINPTTNIEQPGDNHVN